MQLIFLQDVHFLPADIVLWTQQWGLSVLWSCHNAILLIDQSSSLSALIIPAMSARVLLASISISTVTNTLNIGSIYIPADRQVRSELIRLLSDDLGIEFSILAGDCNIIANYTLDHSPPLPGSPPTHWPQFSAVIQGWGMVDLLCSLSSEEPQITHWQQTQTGRVGSCIDYIFINQCQLPLFALQKL